MEDRGDDSAILPGVKKAYRPDWLNDANKVFINKLNDVCGSYQDVFNDVSTAHPTNMIEFSLTLRSSFRSKH